MRSAGNVVNPKRHAAGLIASPVAVKAIGKTEGQDSTHMNLHRVSVNCTEIQTFLGASQFGDVKLVRFAEIR